MSTLEAPLPPLFSVPSRTNPSSAGLEQRTAVHLYYLFFPIAATTATVTNQRERERPSAHGRRRLLRGPAVAPSAPCRRLARTSQRYQRRRQRRRRPLPRRSNPSGSEVLLRSTRPGAHQCSSSSSWYYCHYRQKPEAGLSGEEDRQPCRATAAAAPGDPTGAPRTPAVCVSAPPPRYRRRLCLESSGRQPGPEARRYESRRGRGSARRRAYGG